MKTINCLIIVVLMMGCSEEYLEKKPNKSIVVPSTFDDFKSLLNNTSIMNVTPTIGVLGTDDYFTTNEGWLQFTNNIERFGYTWERDIYQGMLSCADWTTPYQQVFYSNVVLDALNKIEITPANKNEWNTIRGRALFHRAFACYHLAQVFCQPYREDAGLAPGIPLRLTSDVGEAVKRATIEETYDQILKDLQEADALVPRKAVDGTEPSQATTRAAMAKVYLSMGDYAKAGQFASEALDLENSLLDYNTLDETSISPIPRFNEEVLFHASAITYRFSTSALTYVDTLLYDSYSDDDLRKSVFFRERASNRYTYKGNYTASSSLFGGITTSELYLTRAECRVRNGDVVGALADLNALLVKRWRAGTFTLVTENDPDKLLTMILEERRKELVFRPDRWTDLRRLNQEERFKRTLVRELNGVVYSLPPNDPRYVYPIPPQEVMLSGIEQNER